MVMISQQTLPLDTTNRQASRRLSASTTASTVGVSRGPIEQRVRWGAAVVEPAKRSQASSWSEVSSKVRRGRRTTVWVDEALPQVASRAQVASRPQPARPRVIRELAPAPKAVAAEAGDSFARNRIRHAFELFGACMMIITFLAFAMFA